MLCRCGDTPLTKTPPHHQQTATQLRDALMTHVPGFLGQDLTVRALHTLSVLGCNVTCNYQGISTAQYLSAANSEFARHAGTEVHKNASRTSSSFRLWLRDFSLRFTWLDCDAGTSSFFSCAARPPLSAHCCSFKIAHSMLVLLCPGHGVMLQLKRRGQAPCKTTNLLFCLHSLMCKRQHSYAARQCMCASTNSAQSISAAIRYNDSS